MTYKQSHGLYIFTVIQSFSQLYRHSHGLYNNLKALVNPYPKEKSAFRTLKMLLESLRVLIEDKRIFVESVCAGPGHENACRGREGDRPANDSAVEAVRVLLRVVRVLVKAVRVGELC